MRWKSNTQPLIESITTYLSCQRAELRGLEKISFGKRTKEKLATVISGFRGRSHLVDETPHDAPAISVQRLPEDPISSTETSVTAVVATSEKAKEDISNTHSPSTSAEPGHNASTNHLEQITDSERALLYATVSSPTGDLDDSNEPYPDTPPRYQRRRLDGDAVLELLQDHDLQGEILQILARRIDAPRSETSEETNTQLPSYQPRPDSESG